MWLVGPIEHERSSHRYWRISLLTDPKVSWSASQRQSGLNRVRRCSYCRTYQRRKTILLGWWWMRTARTSRHSLHAERRRWMSLLAQTKTDSGAQDSWSKGGFMWKSSYSRCPTEWKPLFVGCWGVWTTGSSRHLKLPSRRRWLPVSTDSPLRHSA